MARKRQRFQPEPQEGDPSRSDARTEDREVTATLGKLADDLAALRKEQRATLELPTMLEDSIIELARVTKGAKVRQRRYCVKQLRTQDFEALRHAVDLFDASSDASHRRGMLLERLRADMLGEAGDAIIERFLDEHPAAERQRLRQLVRAARKESQGAPDSVGPKQKALYRYLRDHV